MNQEPEVKILIKMTERELSLEYGNSNYISLEELKDYFECPICLNVPRKAPIWQCDKVFKRNGSMQGKNFLHYVSTPSLFQSAAHVKRNKSKFCLIFCIPLLIMVISGGIQKLFR